MDANKRTALQVAVIGIRARALRLSKRQQFCLDECERVLQSCPTQEDIEFWTATIQGLQNELRVSAAQTLVVSARSALPKLSAIGHAACGGADPANAIRDMSASDVRGTAAIAVLLGAVGAAALAAGTRRSSVDAAASQARGDRSEDAQKGASMAERH